MGAKRQDPCACYRACASSPVAETIYTWLYLYLIIGVFYGIKILNTWLMRGRIIVSVSQISLHIRWMMGGWFKLAGFSRDMGEMCEGSRE